MRKMKEGPLWWRIISYFFVTMAAILSGAYFFAFWAADAESMGAHDANIGIAAAYGAVAAVYVTLGLALITTLNALLGLYLRQPTKALWIATGICLLPIGFVALISI